MGESGGATIALVLGPAKTGVSSSSDRCITCAGRFVRAGLLLRTGATVSLSITTAVGSSFGTTGLELEAAAYSLLEDLADLSEEVDDLAFSFGTGRWKIENSWEGSFG